MYRFTNNGQCNKRGYSKKEAQTKKNDRRHHGALLRIYVCPNCNQWHLTHKTRQYENI